MLSHRRHLRRAALTVTCCALAAPSLASAAQGGDTPADFGHPVAVAAMAAHASTESPRSLAAGLAVGDTPADYPGSPAVAAKVGYTHADFPHPVAFGGPRAADTRVDLPVAFGGPRAGHIPRSTSIVAPDRTAVRDVHEALPIVVSSAALLLALCGFGLVLVRSGVLRRRLTERSH
jgi:hypothetical protein